jgi:hypothetical protein
MVNVGLSEIIEPEVLIAKRPRIDHNAVFDSSVFGVTFDAFLARSIWTHASKAMIATMLDNFVRDSSSRAFFLTSYLPARWPWEDYKGTAHIGRSHVSKIPGLVKHNRRWIKSECQARGLSVRELSDGILMDQKWLKICRLPSESPVYPYRSGRRVED